MNQTLNSIINNFYAGKLSTPNIQVIEERFANETIQLSYPNGVGWSSFRKSDLKNMKFMDTCFEWSYFDTCIFENCMFEGLDFNEASFDNCVFKNCQFVRCNLSDAAFDKTIFHKCTFIKNYCSVALFESCDFRKPIFEGVERGINGPTLLVDCKFSNSKESIEFKGDVGFYDIQNQLERLGMIKC